MYKSDDISTGCSSIWADGSITINNPSMVARPKEDNTVVSSEIKKTVLRASVVMFSVMNIVDRFRLCNISSMIS